MVPGTKQAKPKVPSVPQPAHKGTVPRVAVAPTSATPSKDKKIASKSNPNFTSSAKKPVKTHSGSFKVNPKK